MRAPESHTRRACHDGNPEGLRGGGTPPPRPLNKLPSPVSTVERAPPRLRTTRSYWAPRSRARGAKVPGETGSFCCAGKGGLVRGGATWREPEQPRGASTGQCEGKWTVRMAQTVTAHSLSSEDLDCMREGHTGRWGGGAAAPCKTLRPRGRRPSRDRPLTRLGTTNTLRDLQGSCQRASDRGDGAEGTAQQMERRAQNRGAQNRGAQAKNTVVPHTIIATLLCFCVGENKVTQNTAC